MSWIGMKGAICGCRKCGSMKVKWDPDTDTNTCLECGWTDKEEINHDTGN